MFKIQLALRNTNFDRFCAYYPLIQCHFENQILIEKALSQFSLLVITVRGRGEGGGGGG